MLKNSLMFYIIIWLSIFFGGVNGFATTLSWEEPDSGTITGYRVYYGIDSNNMALLQQVSSSIKQLSLDSFTLEQDKTYFFGIKGYNTAGESDFSNIVSYTPGDTTPPLSPLGVTVE